MPKMTVAQKREFLVEMCNCREYLKTDVELNKAVLKKHLKFLPQQKLYKFRACIEREFRMLEENCIWMSLASSFPDPFDHINRVVNRSRGCCIKQIKLFREDIAVRFFIISDLHLGEETDMQQLYTRTRTLCRKIRESTTPGEQIPIILLGDIVDGGNPDAFCAAKKLLTKIEQELKDYSTTFDFVPGNHDLHGTDLAAFDKFISKYGVPKFSENRAYNRQYGGVNFIFADSNLSRDHRACGEIDVAAIIELVKGGMTNVLLCHHSFTQEYGDLQVNNCSSRYIMYVEMSQGSRCVKSCRISLRSQRVLN